jgi:hypothetical protein
MPTWSPISTTQTPSWSSITTQENIVFDFNTFATLEFSVGCFADGSTGDFWGIISTTQTPNWTQITT